jgi:integral membrane protein (TIGR01906 family)
MPSWLPSALRIALIIAMPFALVLVVVKFLLATDVFPKWEYNLPETSYTDQYNLFKFPVDYYGFTNEDRLKVALISMEYLNNDADISFLAKLTIPQEKVVNPEVGTRMYNDRELKHMEDVKVVVRGMNTVMIIAWVVLLISINTLGWGAETRPLLRSGLIVGSIVTAVALVGIVLFSVIGFSTFFVLFHKIFFTGDTWLFNWYDTLIRCFPTKFWFDSFLWIGLGSLLEAAIVGVTAWFWKP